MVMHKNFRQSVCETLYAELTKQGHAGYSTSVVNIISGWENWDFFAAISEIDTTLNEGLGLPAQDKA